MGLMTFLRNRKLAKEQRRLAWELGVAGAWANLNSDLLDADEFPGGSGDFGRSADNPVPCADPVTYFARLRTLEGQPVRLSCRFSVRSSVTRKPVDAYVIDSAGERSSIYVCIYCRRNSLRAPIGFQLI
jgi:hypothetical protein